MLTEDEFLSAGSTVAVTYKRSMGILCIGEAHVYEDGGLGYRPDAPFPAVAVDHLEGSVLAFIKGIPRREIDSIFLACCRGDFFGALAYLAILYRGCPESQRGIGAPSHEVSEDLHRALQFKYPRVSKKGGDA